MPENAAISRVSVAVIIVNWNAGELLVRCLSAVSRQTVQPKQIFVVDNASSDGSCDTVASHFPDVTLICLDQNTGFAAANNLAVQRADGCEWVALLNPDAFPESTWLEKLLTAAKNRPEYTFFGSRMLMADAPDRLDGVGDVYHVSGLVWREGHGMLASGNFLEEREIFSPCAAAALYRRDAFLDAGGFDEDYFCYIEDVDLGFRLRLLGHRCLYVPEAIVTHKGAALTGKASDFSVYHGHRNLVWTYIKNFPKPWFWLYLPQHVALNFLTPFALLPGGFRAACNAKIDALFRLPRTWRKRRQIEKRACVEFRSLRPLLATGLHSLIFRRLE